MIKLNTSYSKKVPVEGQQFSSESFHASVEIELADNLSASEIQDKIHSTAELLRQSVDAELCQTRKPEQAQERQRGAFTPRQQQGGRQQERASEGSQRKASNKQVKYLTDLAGENHVTLQDLNAEILERYGVAGLYDLNAAQASEMIDSLTGGRNRRRAA
jgi:hypothetical protein